MHGLVWPKEIVYKKLLYRTIYYFLNSSKPSELQYILLSISFEQTEHFNGILSYVHDLITISEYT